MSNSRKLFNIVGPYPYSPGLLFLTIFLCLASRYQVVLFDIPPGLERVRALIAVLFLAAGPGIIVALMTSLLTRFRRWNKNNLIFYVLEIMGIIAMLRITRFFSQKSSLWHTYVPENAWIPTNWLTLIAALLFGLLMNGVLNYAQKATVGKLAEAQELVNKLSEKHELLISADEQVREQTSRFLHDRVQSDLMVVGIKLKSIQGTASIEINDVIDKAISRLETTRSADLKNIIQVLSPNFDASGLKGSFGSLIKQYESNLAVTIQVDSASEELDSHYLLGAYRIVEQGLLNCLIHGPANKVLVSMTTDAAGRSEIMISDDGPGADLDSISSGVGTAVIDSWVGILNGKKTVDTVPGHGYRLVINFPA